LVEGGTAGVDRALLKAHSRVFPISAVSRDGLKELVGELALLLGQSD
jgi:hypothetical protein